MSDLLEALRVANCPLAIGVALAFFVRINDMWHRYGAGGRVLRVGLLLLLGSVAYGSAEAYLTHAPLGVRTLVVTVALAVCATGLALMRRHPEKL